MKPTVTVYESINDLLQALNTKNNSYMAHKDDSQDSSFSFTGTHSYAEAMDLLRNGWEHGAKKLASPIKLSIKDQQDVKRSVQEFNVVGQQAIVPLYLQGVPTSMLSRVNKPTKQKIIVINRAITYNMRVSQEDILKEGLKTIQIIQSLEKAGLRVKLNVSWCSTSKRGDQVLLAKVCIKQPQERLNISKLAFTLGHPSMLRRIALKWYETTPTMTSSGFSGGYGTPNNEVIQTAFPKEYFIPSFLGDVKDFINKVMK